jgi:hypothetical protein
MMRRLREKMRTQWEEMRRYRSRGVKTVRSPPKLAAEQWRQQLALCHVKAQLHMGAWQQKG